jgi:hypothetical protein
VKAALGFPGILGLDEHPSLRVRPDGKRIRPSTLRKHLTKVIYHSDFENLFLDSAPAGRAHDKRKRQQAFAAAKLVLKKGQQQEKDFDSS